MRRGFLEVTAVFFIAALVGAIVRAPYWDCPMVHDDWLIQWLLGLWWTGRTSAVGTLFAEFSDQVIPLWNLAYSAQLRVFGLNPVGWHLIALLFHSLSAALLYVVVVLYAKDRVAGLVAALPWGAVAIGRWDNALLWVGAAIMPLVLTLLLAAMATQRLWLETGYRRWAVLASVSLFTMVATWHITALLLSGVIAQWILLDRPLARGKGLAWLGLMAPALLWTGFSTIWSRLFGHPSVEVRYTLESLTLVLERTVEMLSVALANLTFWSAGPLETSDLWYKVALACVAAASLIFAAPTSRRLVLVFATPVGILLLALNTRRIDMPLAELLSGGRYYYLPTLFWCVVAGVAAQSLRRAFSKPRLASIPAAVVVTIVLAAFVWRQSVIALNARTQFFDLWGSRIEQFQANVDMLNRIRANGTGSPVVLPDIPLLIPAVEDHYYPLSVLAAISGWDPVDLNRFRRIDDMTEQEIKEAQGVFRSSGHSLGMEWSRTSARFAEDMRAVLWLEALANERGHDVAVPSMRLSYSERWNGQTATPPLEECLRYGLSSPTPHLTIGGSDADTQALRALLSKSSRPEAETWRHWLAEDARTPKD